ncbi:MAG TPA: RagB/SusD family nutrient uptake outer membrane protein, partial [Flavisolibacter sp.]|nr:RagB/SusD family nutrient uptake outer membrane protein [Flavisolibacter sp.]
RSALSTSITHYAYGDLVSDEITDVVGGDGAFRDVFLKNWGIGIPFANTWDPRIKLRVYTNFYAAIAQSNRCLYYINQMPVDAFEGSSTEEKQKRKNKYLGEAYFTRAFNYFYMTRIWGDVPLVTEHITDPSTAQQLPRTPQAQVLAKAIEDLQQAKNFLDWKDNGAADRVVRGDKGAVNALLAHIYAWQGKYEECAAACDAVIQSGGYSLVDANDYLSIYKGKSSEGIFELASSPSESQIATDAWTITGVTLTRPYIEGPVIPAWQINTGLTNWLYSNSEDVRYKKAFVELNNNGATVVECIKYANIQNINNNPANQIAVNNIIVFRLADILLLKAEALAAKAAPDPGGAMALVNQIRSNRGLAADPISGLSGTDLLYAIADERGRELFLEGHRYYDLVRLERLTKAEEVPFVTYAEFSAGKYYWPLDPTLFLTNSNLTQTPFWRDKMK